MAARTSELRRARRYRLSAPAYFTWKTPDGVAGKGEGTTRDISSLGVFICAPCLLPVGSMLGLEVLLPPIQSSSRPLQLHAQARVVRTEYLGFAATGDMGFRMEFANSPLRRQVELTRKGRSDLDGQAIACLSLQS